VTNRKVKISLTLVGRSHFGYDKFKDLSNEEILFMIENQIIDQFGKRPLFIHDKESVSFEAQKYPKFYAAGWFVSEEPVTDTDGIGSELVVVAHGEDMKTARLSMMRAVSMVKWNKFAKNI
jgi:hypothetical protein